MTDTGADEGGRTAGGRRPPSSSPTARRTPVANPRPRPALARVRPLPSDDASSPEPLEPRPDTPVPAAAARVTEPTAGRDVLIPEAGRPSRGRPGKPPRTTGLAIPALTELMPPAAPTGRRRKHGHRDAPAQPAGPAARPGKGTKDKGTKDSGAKDGKDGGKRVELVVPMSKGLRKRLRAKAAELGVPPEEAVARLVEVWVDA